jgi:hypothetical protein
MLSPVRTPDSNLLRPLGERGVSIMEFALILPLLVLLLGVSIDISFRVRSLNDINTAAQRGVRAASTYTVGTAATCPAPGSPIVVTDHGVCPNTPGLATIDASMTAAQVARLTSCNYLEEHKYDSTNWATTTKIGYKLIDGTFFATIEVELREQNADCVVCFQRFAQLVKIDADASSGLQGCPAFD